MMKRCFLFIIMVFVAISTMLSRSQATPPDIVAVKDNLLAMSDDAFYVLRTVTDNTGSYARTVSTVYLVETKWESGQETFWPVQQSQIVNDDNQAYHVKISVVPLEQTYEPFRVLAEKKAISIDALEPWGMPDETISHMDVNDIWVRNNENEKYGLPTEKAFVAIRSSQDELAKRLPDYQRLGSLTVGDLLSGDDYSSENCKIAEPVAFFGIKDNKPIMMAQIRCYDDDIQILSRVIYLPPKP